MDRIQVHFANASAMAKPFHLTSDVFRRVAEGIPELRDRLVATFSLDDEGFDKNIRTADALVGWRFPREQLAALAPRLRWIHLVGAGVEHLAPFDWVPKGARLTNNRGIHARKAAEYALMGILMLNAEIPTLMENQRRRIWERRFTASLRGKTLVVVGTGTIGASAARAVRRLGMRVIGVRRSGRPHPSFDEVVGTSHLDAVLPLADFLLVAAPLTNETKGLIGARRLALMKGSAGIINMSRAAIMDYDALRLCLSQGRFAGALLDVFDPEPVPPSSVLWDTPRLVMTPHCGADDAAAFGTATMDLVLKNALRILSGRTPLGCVNIRRGY